ncbi:hypothetical protein ACFX2B_040877 [Malus domestica]
MLTHKHPSSSSLSTPQFSVHSDRFSPTTTTLIPFIFQRSPPILISPATANRQPPAMYVVVARRSYLFAAPPMDALDLLKSDVVCGHNHDLQAMVRKQNRWGPGEEDGDVWMSH